MSTTAELLYALSVASGIIRDMSDRLHGGRSSKYADCLDEIADIIKEHEWISVNDRLPEPFISVLVVMPEEAPFPTVREGFVNGYGTWSAGNYVRNHDEVTHWRTMPQPPQDTQEAHDES